MEPDEGFVTVASFNLADLWEGVVDTVPDRTAVVSGDRRLTYREVDERASRLAQWMSNQGVSAGSSVGLQMTNINEHVEAALATFKLRASPINLNYRLTSEELRFLYDHAMIEGVIHDQAFEPNVRKASEGVSIKWSLPVGPRYEAALGSVAPAARIPRSNDDPYVIYTGGTTGNPKAVEWTARSAFFGCIGGGDPMGTRGAISHPAQISDRLEKDIAFVPAPPLMHAAGMWTTLRWLFAGAKVVLIPTYSAQAIVDSIRSEQVTHVNIVGDAMAVRLAAALEQNLHAGLESIKVLASGGAPLSEPVRTRLLDALPRLTVRDSYGSSETGVHAWATHLVGTPSAEAAKFDTRDTLLLDPETLQPIPLGDERSGLVARHTYVPLRYRNDAAASERTFIMIDGVPVAVTGDLGVMTPDGRLTLLGRGSTCINTGGEKVFPDEVEAVLRARPEIEDCLVLGTADPVWGQKVVALIQVSGGKSIDAAELQEHCRRFLASFKVPKQLFTVSAVPRTASGKADYRAAASVLDDLTGEVDQ